ncbi:hypothetical protein [Bilophila wadsworthia]|uniref:hypothetical protein n=1 Tax=Bilophila wadsworthia TaxID=35833 RepID=UPI003990DC20
MKTNPNTFFASSAGSVPYFAMMDPSRRPGQVRHVPSGDADAFQAIGNRVQVHTSTAGSLIARRWGLALGGCHP